MVPAVRIGRVWRFEKENIDKWISGGGKNIKQIKNAHSIRTRSEIGQKYCQENQREFLNEQG